MTIWLLKTEPGEFSFDDLVARGVEPWDGVTNPTALNNMRAAQPGEVCVIYHTGDERQAVGLATVERTAYPDPKLNNDKVIVIDVRAGARLPKPVTLAQIKADPRFADSPLVKMGRLSVVPLTDQQYAAILELSGM
ncbi:MAG: EVE domain-containing protein [Chloroflexi bacterium]|nr:EVE domain-containing protein [Chloroflexota bacterium]MBV9134592.1 EVE domain-containing protein [Chloroflexota bacterium]MBV9897187.1 EVE domain-containing protein [Chloroflexota bacterium]